MARDKAGKIKVPKQVAGVKLPKKLRKAGKKALKIAEQPVVGEAVAAALLAAAAALREDKGSGAKAVGKEAAKFGEALRAYAIDVARRTLDAWEESAATPAKAPHESRAGKGAKKGSKT